MDTFLQRKFKSKEIEKNIKIEAETKERRNISAINKINSWGYSLVIEVGGIA
jgi:hypothetical protein